MSSTYRLLCLNHDPAIYVHDYDRTKDELLDIAREARIEGHEHCDLLLAEFSGGLIRIGCPGGAGCPGHRVTFWVEAAWLQLLHIAHAHDIGFDQLRIRSCWTRERVLRLWQLLGMERLP